MFVELKLSEVTKVTELQNELMTDINSTEKLQELFDIILVDKVTVNDMTETQVAQVLGDFILERKKKIESIQTYFLNLVNQNDTPVMN